MSNRIPPVHIPPGGGVSASTLTGALLCRHVNFTNKTTSASPYSQPLPKLLHPQPPFILSIHSHRPSQGSPVYPQPQRPIRSQSSFPTRLNPPFHTFPTSASLA